MTNVDLSEPQELTGHCDNTLSICDCIADLNDSIHKLNDNFVVPTIPLNTNNNYLKKDLRITSKVLGYIIKETKDIANKIDFIQNYVDFSEANMEKIKPQNNPSNPDCVINCAVDFSETKKRAIDVFLLTLIEQYGAQGIAEALGIDTQIVVNYYTKCGGEPLHEKEK